MALSDGYGLVIGTLVNYYRDPPDNYGRYYHGNLILGTPAGQFHCAIDVDPKFMPDGIEWRVVRIRPPNFAAFKAMTDGWHPLPSNATSGALDYIRSPMLQPPILFWRVRYPGMFWRILEMLELLRWHPPWKHGTGIDALTALEGVIAPATRFYVFGEPFNSGLGVHNVHQNQGDPAGSGHELENATWQDGATIVETATGEFIGFLNKFKTQAYRTDANGRPLHLPWPWLRPLAEHTHAT
jgi:hypothetical protein